MIKYLSDKYDKHFLAVELLISVVITLVVYFIIYFLNIEGKIMTTLNGSRAALYGTIAAVCGSLLGFVITGLSVLMVTGNSEGMKALKSSKHYKEIFRVFFSTSKYLGLLVVISLITLIIDRDSSPFFSLNILVLWGVIIATFRILRCLWVLERIIEINK